MSNFINTDFLVILLALFVTASLGFLIGWLMKSIKLNSISNSSEALSESNKKVNTQIKSDSEYKRFDAQLKKIKKSAKVDEKIKTVSTYEPTAKVKNDYIKEKV